jgi:hypothetical protein
MLVFLPQNEDVIPTSNATIKKVIDVILAFIPSNLMFVSDMRREGVTWHKTALLVSIFVCLIYVPFFLYVFLSLSPKMYR